MEIEIKSLNIYEKMQKITDELGIIAKGLNVQVNKSASYKAVSERDILDNVKPLESKYRVYSYPIKREITDRDILIKETEFTDSRTDNTTVTRTNTIFMRISTIYRFVNLDNPGEYVETIIYGDGLDTGDKAPGKAMTYADKYALMKMYKISTGDDPDKDASPEQGYKKESNKNDNKKLQLIVKLTKLVEDTKTDYEKILEFYKVKSNADMNISQLEEAIATLERRAK